MSELVDTLRKAQAAIREVAIEGSVEAALAKKLIGDLEDAIEHVEGRASSSDLIGVACHDLRDPLASIVMGAGFLARTIPTADGPAHRVIGAISRSAARMSRVVTDFHDLSKLERGALGFEAEAVDVGPVIDEVLAAAQPDAEHRKVSLRREPTAPGLSVLADRSYLAKVLAKLVDNAVRFSSAGGEVVVSVGSSGDRARFGVKDAGRGIAAERRAEIFDRRANAKRAARDGPGLGLAIAKALVALQGGEIGFESSDAPGDGRGSTFWFTLSRASA